ncbi:hypothetical protein DIC82_02330 [Clostridium beijerinckii]|nr:hypothetical protein DIC82_02330 [Clostridium beijerinckii]
MRRKFISKIILGTMISTTLCTLVPIKASAEWVKDYQNNWYYTQDNQRMTGWKRIDGQLYYFDDNGKMQTGWIKAGGSWYFLQNNGVLKTGWINYNKNLYYADSSGEMQTGTVNIAGKVYMLDDNGVAKTRNTVIDGQFYTIGSNGEVVGMKVPTPDKEFDESGNVLTVLKNGHNKSTTSPTDSKFNEVIEDESISDDDPNEGRTFKVRFKDSNGAELKTKSVKNGKSVDLYEPTKSGYVFAGWDTKSDGSGKSYDKNDNIKVKEDINLYAQWADDDAIYVDDITVKGSSYVTINNTSQMTAEISPSDASNTSVTWSVTNGTGKATIDSNGLLTGTANGTVTVKATSKDGSNISGMKEVTVSATEVVVPVSQISVTSNTGVSTITANGGTLQMKASVLPTDANKQDVTWSIENRTGSASIDANGLVTAKSNGTVTVKATATNKDGSTVVGSTTITISGQLLKIPVEGIVLSGADTITADGGTLQMTASILPTTASNKSVTWSVEKVGDTGTIMDGNATISSTGLLKALADGKVTVKATANDGSGIVKTKVITISGQSIIVTKITVNGKDDSTTITADGGTLEMSAIVTPTTASKKAVTWSVENVDGSAKIDSNGVLTAISNGTVTVKATATDGSKVVGTKDIELSGQSTIIPVSSIVVSGTNDATSITTDNGTLKMIATVVPTSTTSQAVTWAVSSGTGTATMDADGTLHAVTNGTVIVKATSVDYPKVIGTKTISLSGQFVEAISITVNSTGNASEAVVDGTLQMSASILPINTTYKTVKWSVDSVAGSTGTATITSTGVLTGKSAGDVNVIATATDGTGIFGSKTIKIIPQVLVDGITVITPSDSNEEIKSPNGTLQMSANFTPYNVTNQVVIWSVESIYDPVTGLTGKATISPTGLLTAVSNGAVKVKAISTDNGKVASNPITITISNQVVKATGFALKGFALNGGVIGTTEVAQITVDKGTLQMQANVFPTNATTTPSAITWSVEQIGDTGTAMTGKASVDSTGKLTAIANGTVTVRSTATILGGTQVITGAKVITISGQIILVTDVLITGLDTVVSGKTLQLPTDIKPTNATNQTVKWTVTDFGGTGDSIHAAIDASGKLTAVSAGTVMVTATANDGSGKSFTKTITIT